MATRQLLRVLSPAYLAQSSTSLKNAQRLALTSQWYPVLREYATAGSSVIEVNDDVEYSKLVLDNTKDGKLLVVDFTAKWCGPCRMIAPLYEKLSGKYPQVVFTKVDIDKATTEQSVRDQNVTGVPTFVFFKGGRLVESFSGARPELLEDLVKKHSS